MCVLIVYVLSVLMELHFELIFFLCAAFVAMNVTPVNPPHAANYFLDDGTPVIVSDSSLFYYSTSGNGSADLIERIQAVASAHASPFFIIAYGGIVSFPALNLLEAIAQVRSGLPADQFEVVGMQDFVSYC